MVLELGTWAKEMGTPHETGMEKRGFRAESPAASVETEDLTKVLKHEPVSTGRNRRKAFPIETSLSKGSEISLYMQKVRM